MKLLRIVTAFLAGVPSIQGFQAPDTARSMARIYLANGDVLLGKLAEVEETHVVLEPWSESVPGISVPLEKGVKVVLLAPNERIEQGSEVFVRLPGQDLRGRVRDITHTHFVLEPLRRRQQMNATIAYKDVHLIRPLGFGDSLTGRILKTSARVTATVPVVAIAVPFIVLEFGWIGGVRLVTGEWPTGP
jgi:hypothetical protein